MLKTRLVAGRNNKELHSYDGYDDDPVLVTTTHAAHDGHFASAVIEAATTTTIVASNSNQGIALTDLIVSVGKTNGTEVTIQFTDTVAIPNIVIIAKIVTDTGATMAIPFGGRWAGWQGSQIDVVTNNAADVSVAVGYFRTPEDKTMAYSEWDASR